jgi:hypothetical protein
MEGVVTRIAPMALCGTLLLCLAPAVARAQPAAQVASSAAAPAGDASDFWLAAGGAFATLRGDCQTCEEEFPYRRGGSVMADIGYRVNARMDVGAEVFWLPIQTSQGRIHTTHLDAIAQFRPWRSKGFFLKGGAGMALVRNWVDVVGPDAFNQKALSVVIGAGWAFRPSERVGLQVFGAQHAAALGDLKTGEDPVEDVMGNFWSLGVALVIR